MSRQGSARCPWSCTTAYLTSESSWIRMNWRRSPCKRYWRPPPSTREPSTWSVGTNTHSYSDTLIFGHCETVSFSFVFSEACIWWLWLFLFSFTLKAKSIFSADEWKKHHCADRGAHLHITREFNLLCINAALDLVLPSWSWCAYKCIDSDSAHFNNRNQFNLIKSKTGHVFTDLWLWRRW